MCIGQTIMNCYSSFGAFGCQAYLAMKLASFAQTADEADSFYF
jgi:hypothetical protein